MSSRLLLVIAAVLWSTAGAAMKLCHLSGWQIGGARSLVAGSFLFLAVAEARRRPTPLVFATGVAYAATVTLFAMANKLTTAANAIFIQSSAPLWVLLLSPWLLRERPSRPEILAVPIYAVGLGLFFLDDLSPGQLAGNLISLVAGLAFALSIVGFRRLRERGPSALVIGNLISALATSPFWLQGPTPGATDIVIILYLGVFQLGLAYLCFSRGVANTPALEASLLVLLEPVLNPIWTFLFAGERPGPWAILGGSIVLLATLWRIAAPRLGRLHPSAST
jgi:DME family drug/metabolite transporter